MPLQAVEEAERKAREEEAKAAQEAADAQARQEAEARAAEASNNATAQVRARTSYVTPGRGESFGRNPKHIWCLHVNIFCYYVAANQTGVYFAKQASL